MEKHFMSLTKSLRSLFLSLSLFLSCLPTYAITNAASSIETLQKKVEYGDRVAQFELAIAYDFGINVNVDHKKALELYQLSADQGYAEAQYNLAVAYDTGNDITQDKDKAYYWYNKAAEQGYSDAQNNLGTMYENGEGVAIDYNKAFLLYKQSAENGSVTGQYNIAEMYANGKGPIKQDLIQAYAWFSVAEQNGDNNALAKKTEGYKRLLTPALKTEAKQLAESYKQKYSNLTK